MVRADPAQTGLENCPLDVFTGLCAANKDACRAFEESNPSLLPSGQFCRLELTLDAPLHHAQEDRTELELYVERYLDSPDTGDHLRPCLLRLSRHQREWTWFQECHRLD